jgi:hypothetical protein
MESDMMSRAEVAEEIVRVMSDFAESATIDSEVVSEALARKHLLTDYLRIKANEQHMAYDGISE